MVMLVLRDRASHPFMLEMMSIIVSQNVKTRVILDYKGEGGPIQHIQVHDSSL